MPLRVKVLAPALVNEPAPEIAPVMDEAAVFVMLSEVDVLIAPAVTAAAVMLSCPMSLDEPTAPAIVTLPEPAVRFKREGARLVSSTYWFRL